MFLHDLTSKSKVKKVALERGDYSLLLNCLRCGLTLEELEKCLPGMKTETLLGAYRDLERRLKLCLQAWKNLEKNPTEKTLYTNLDDLMLMTPSPTSRLLRFACIEEEDIFAEEIKIVFQQMHATRAKSLTLENDLKSLQPPSEKGVSLGKLLYNPYQPALWDDPYFVPARVGELTPVRLRLILGESKE